MEKRSLTLDWAKYRMVGFVHAYSTILYFIQKLSDIYIHLRTLIYNLLMGKIENVKAWLTSAEDNVSVAGDMYRLNHLNWSLFMWGLAIEKILKAYLLLNDVEVPYTHDLHKLYLLTKLKADDDLIKDLKEITTFNVSARYEETKYDLYKKSTQEYTDKYVSRSKDIYICIKNNLKV